MAVLVTGCPGNSNKGGGGGAATGGGSTGDETATFSLAWSEYPSWSVFGAAEDMGLIDGAAGAMGEFETKHGIDIELKELDYEPCLTAYAAGEVDAVCITNIDILSPALQRDSVAIMPTSTSDGADACLVVGNLTVDQLKEIPTFGLERSVSQFCFERNLELLKKNPVDFEFKQMDPAVAAGNMQANPDQTQSIVVWNPFVLETLRKQSKSRVLFDSS
ncbi:MAG: hypothetical protein AAFP90_18475, partial [Planctomycetota bacterium]